MPDFERLTDDLSKYYGGEYQNGFVDGKTRARIEVAIVSAVIGVMCILAIGMSLLFLKGLKV